MKSSISIWHVMPICVLMIFSCRNSKEQKDAIPLSVEKQKYLSDYIGENILKDFKGTVTDSIGQPLDSVSITIGTITTLTDKNGTFAIENTIVNERFVFASLNKKGYKDYTLDISERDSLKNISIQLYKEGELSLHWFSKHNHNLPNSSQ